MKARYKIFIGFFCLFSLIFVQLTLAKEKAILRIGYRPILPQLPLIVSYNNDRYNLQKVDLKLLKYNSFTSLEAAMCVGAIDVASLPVPIALSMAANDCNIKIIGMFHLGGSRLVTIKKGNLESIQGKLIGVPGLDTNENLRLAKVFKEKNMKLGIDFKTITMPLRSSLGNLKSNKIYGIYMPEPFGSIAEKEKIVYEIEGQEVLTGKMDTVIVVRDKYLKKHKQALKEWIKSIKDSCKFIENDIKNTSAQQSSIIQETYFLFPKDIVIESLSKRKGNLTFTYSLPKKEEIKQYMDMASEMKILNKTVDLDNLIYEPKPG